MFSSILIIIGVYGVTPLFYATGFIDCCSINIGTNSFASSNVKELNMIICKGNFEFKNSKKLSEF